MRKAFFVFFFFPPSPFSPYSTDPTTASFVRLSPGGYQTKEATLTLYNRTAMKQLQNIAVGNEQTPS